MAKPRILILCVRFVLALLVSAAAATRAAEGETAEIKTAAGLQVEKFVGLQELSAFTWDEQGVVWALSAKGNRFILWRVPKATEMQTIGSFERRGNERGSLLVHGKRVFVTDGDAIRIFQIRDGRHAAEESALIAPPNLFPKGSQISSLGWSPLGHISFRYRSQKEEGTGRVDLKRERWDVVAKGLAGDWAYDLNGFPIASDETSGQLFRVGLGLDYERGLHNYTKNALALSTDKAGVKPMAVAAHAGANWPEENRGTWLVFDGASSSLEQFKEEDEGLKHWRRLAEWKGRISHADLQIGPDGAIWIMLGAEGENGRDGAIYRLRPETFSGAPDGSLEIAGLETKEVVALLKHANSWQREAALRVLDDREELRQARGLHPNTPLHSFYNDTNNTVVARIHALLALHRVELLDETMLENVADVREPALRMWAAFLFGERNYPSGTAFTMLEKLAKEPNIEVRMAVAVAARQFVSGSLAIDTAPRAMPIREVFTGGILSTLWFSTEKSSSPAFDLLYWNAVRPISAYDSAHPMGFFQGDREEGLPIAYWVVGLITQQIAEQDNPLKQEDAMLMVGEMKPTNSHMIVAALQGLKNGTANRRVIPTEKSLKVLSDFARSENCGIAALAQEILAAWKKGAGN